MLGLGSITTGKASVAGLVGSSLVPLGLLGLGGAIGAGLAIGGVALRWACCRQAEPATEQSASNTSSSTSVFYKKVSDWAADSLMLTGLGYALGVPMLGWGAALLIAYAAYVRALADYLGLNQLPASGFSEGSRLALCALIIFGMGAGMPMEYLTKGMGALLVISAVACLTSTTAVPRALKEGAKPASRD